MKNRSGKRILAVLGLWWMAGGLVWAQYSPAEMELLKLPKQELEKRNAPMVSHIPILQRFKRLVESGDFSRPAIEKEFGLKFSKLPDQPARDGVVYTHRYEAMALEEQPFIPECVREFTKPAQYYEDTEARAKNMRHSETAEIWFRRDPRWTEEQSVRMFHHVFSGEGWRCYDTTNPRFAGKRYSYLYFDGKDAYRVGRGDLPTQCAGVGIIKSSGKEYLDYMEAASRQPCDISPFDSSNTNPNK